MPTGRKTYWFEKVYELRDKLNFSRDEITLYHDDIKLLVQILNAGEGELYPTRQEVESQLPPPIRQGEVATETPKPPTGRQTMTMKEVATYFGVSYSKIHELTRMREIPFFMIGNRKLFRQTELDEWIKTQNQLRKTHGGDKP